MWKAGREQAAKPAIGHASFTGIKSRRVAAENKKARLKQTGKHRHKNATLKRI
ncbi:hypothetical protein [uncultured Mucilaginibacter sp.]|uniref:hypothetical protein n=1 Tax=uncultured Mucilaginibacter sp. TaxID=797541 RepID=UPI00263782F3|nr:hypothetical protein [uncultured Mucilaginibacter sp.]